MKRYYFIQGFLIGVLVWGVISVGLRYIHYQFKAPIPHVLLAPGKVLKPIAKLNKLEKVSEPKEDVSWCNWENVQTGVSFCANMVTIIIPLISGTFSFLLWRKQRIINNEVTK